MCNDHIFWMEYSLYLASKAEENYDIPVGSVIVYNNVLLSEGWNQSICKNDITLHAEIVAIRKATLLVNTHILQKTSIYVTLEPCLMCLGAIINAKIKNLYYGAQNKLFSVKSFMKNFYHYYNINIISHILEARCVSKIKNFFLNRCRKNIYN